MKCLRLIFAFFAVSMFCGCSHVSYTAKQTVAFDIIEDPCTVSVIVDGVLRFQLNSAETVKCPLPEAPPSEGSAVDLPRTPEEVCDGC